MTIKIYNKIKVSSIQFGGLYTNNPESLDMSHANQVQLLYKKLDCFENSTLMNKGEKDGSGKIVSQPHSDKVQYTLNLFTVTASIQTKFKNKQ